ncbi:hypothetical protein llg_07750 [Luteolibacter sp. LG18]|nr:hypothetical protein llg_07750 [Luteolibacter sp. LG18]
MVLEKFSVNTVAAMAAGLRRSTAKARRYRDPGRERKLMGDRGMNVNRGTEVGCGGPEPRGHKIGQTHPAFNPKSLINLNEIACIPSRYWVLRIPTSVAEVVTLRGTALALIYLLASASRMG